MGEHSIGQALAFLDWSTGKLSGAAVHESTKTLGDLRGIFSSERDWAKMDPTGVVYHVQWVTPPGADTEGGLLWGNTTIEPGTVGDEYFMTHGHFHLKPDRTEFYATTSGSGLLLLMDSARHTQIQEMSPGSLHHIGPGLAHRVINTGAEKLKILACWPSDAGHDYGTIAQQGFSVRVLRGSGSPRIV